MLQRTLPAGFIVPYLPTKTDTLPSGGQWLHEINQPQLSSGYVRTSSNQGIHRANADTITPAQYQPRSASSLIGSSFLFREGLYIHS
jgi:hypothetical protein